MFLPGIIFLFEINAQFHTYMHARVHTQSEKQANEFIKHIRTTKVTALQLGPYKWDDPLN